jgi:uncharacterized RDD family membrane protein YckC
MVFVLFLLASYPLGMIETLGKAIGGIYGDVVFYGAEALALAVVPAYFAYFFSTGSTLGMRALDIHLFSHGSGRAAHPVRAVARALLSLAFLFASLKAYALTRSVEELTARDELWRDLAVTVTVVAVLGNLWKLFDADGRTLWDRLAGLVVVEDVVPASMPDRLWSRWHA